MRNSLYLVSICGLLLVASHSIAGELRYDFDATIGDINGGIQGLELPVEIQSGNTITCSLVLDRELVASALRTNSPSWPSFGYLDMQFAERSANAAFNSGVVIAPFVLDGMPAQEVESAINFGYLPFTDVFPGWNSRLGTLPMSVGLFWTDMPGLRGDEIEQPSAMQLVGLQNRRELQFTIGNPLESTVSFSATISNVSIIPEPRSVLLFFLSMTGLSANAVMLRPRGW